MSGGDGKGPALREYGGLSVSEEDTVGGQQGQGGDQQLLTALHARPLLRWRDCCAGPVTHDWLAEFYLKKTGKFECYLCCHCSAG